MIYTTLINPGELQRLIVNQKNSGKNDLLLLDCSCSIAEPTIGRKLYQEGHIPGAIFVDFDEIVTGTVHKGTGRHPLPSRDTFLKNLKDLGWSPEKQVVIYDQGRLGFATRFWYEMRWAGIEKVAVLNGGFKAWSSQPRPVSTEPTLPTEGQVPNEKPLEQPVEMSLLQENLKTRDYLVIDARPESRFHGIGETIDHKAGHIPGAVSRDGALNFDANGMFKDPLTLRKEFLELLGGRKPSEVIHSCGSGVNATVNLMAMDYCGLFGSHLYPGSWSQWIDDPENPVELN